MKVARLDSFTSVYPTCTRSYTTRPRSFALYYAAFALFRFHFPSPPCLWPTKRSVTLLLWPMSDVRFHVDNEVFVSYKFSLYNKCNDVTFNYCCVVIGMILARLNRIELSELDRTHDDLFDSAFNKISFQPAITTIKQITARIDIALLFHVVLGNVLNQIVSISNKIDSSELFELGAPYRIMNREIIYCDRRYLETKYFKLSSTCVPKLLKIQNKRGNTLVYGVFIYYDVKMLSQTISTWLLNIYSNDQYA